METIGVIGLGAMGSAMAANLLEAGFTVVGYDIAGERVAEHAARGGLVAGAAREVGERAGLVITSLPSAAALHQVAAELHPVAPAIVMETSTLSLADKERARDLLAARGATLLDTPLSGTSAQARERDVVVLASGEPDAVRRAAPVFEGFARAWHDLGPFGAGTKLKLVANLLVTIHNVAAAEALLLARRAGLDPAVALRVLTDGAGTSRMLEVRGKHMVTGEYEPAAMRVALYQKDIDLITELARTYRSPTPLLAASAQLYLAALAQGRGDQDTACVMAVLEQLTDPSRAGGAP